MSGYEIRLGVTLFTCKTCGCLVSDIVRHDASHSAAVRSIYPVGWWDAWQHRALRQHWRYTLRLVKQRKWRAIKNSFNGYLCEPEPFPEGLRRCGSGWTRRRAERDLARRLRGVSQGSKPGDSRNSSAEVTQP